MPVILMICDLNADECSRMIQAAIKLSRFEIRTGNNTIYLYKEKGKSENHQTELQESGKKRHIFTQDEMIFIVKNYGKLRISEIAEQLGLSRKQVEDKIYHMKKSGKWDEILSIIQENENSDENLEEKVIEMYKSGATWKEIEEKCKVNKNSIWSILKKAGIERNRIKGSRPKYLPNNETCNKDCQNCEYAVKEAVGNSFWCKKFQKRVFPQEATS